MSHVGAFNRGFGNNNPYSWAHPAVANAVQVVPPTTGDKNPFLAGTSGMGQAAQQLTSSAGTGKTQLGQ